MKLRSRSPRLIYRKDNGEFLAGIDLNETDTLLEQINARCHLEGIAKCGDDKKRNLDFKASRGDCMNVFRQQTFDQTAGCFDYFSTTG